MRKLMYVALVPLMLLAVAMFSRTVPGAATPQSARNDPAVDVPAMHRALDVRALPDGNVDEGNSD